MYEFLDQALLIQRQQLREIAQGFQEAQILLACVELGVFEALIGGPAAASVVAHKVGADPRGVELLLNAAAALGLLYKSKDQFGNKPLVAACLLPSVPGSMARGIRLQTAFYRRWGRLAEAVRTGVRPEEDRRDEAAGDWVRNFVYGLQDMAGPLAPVIAAALDLPGDRPLRVIDVGGCHAAYSLHGRQGQPGVARLGQAGVHLWTARRRAHAARGAALRCNRTGPGAVARGAPPSHAGASANGSRRRVVRRPLGGDAVA